MPRHRHPLIEAVPYHLDTDISSAETRGVVAIQDRLRAHARSTRVAKNLETLAERVAGIETVPLDPAAARAFGEFCAERLRNGRPPGETEALIATLAPPRGLVGHP